ncbi:MAG: TlyA family RNA methyltransferase [Bdellovibrionaceae bacterium]|nr:TlyA family RNA methyltransferase [Pseudobdellovibrionaceae bacterium]
MKKRLDVLLVEKGFAETRSRAKALVEAGQVYLAKIGGEEKLEKVSLELPGDAPVFVKIGSANRFVSRAGLKLEGALSRIGLSVVNWECLDVGQSTGGFTDCLLQSGAARVVGVDVGKDQLVQKLKEDSRVVFFEGLNARELSRYSEVQDGFSNRKADLIVMDLSFISQIVVLPELSIFAEEKTRLISLVKPQFEVGPEGLGKGGIVRDPLLYEQVQRKITEVAESHGWKVLDYFESPILGKEGNKEFFLYGIKTGD